MLVASSRRVLDNVTNEKLISPTKRRPSLNQDINDSFVTLPSSLV